MEYLAIGGGAYVLLVIIAYFCFVRPVRRGVVVSLPAAPRYVTDPPLETAPTENSREQGLAGDTRDLVAALDGSSDPESPSPGSPYELQRVPQLGDGSGETRPIRVLVACDDESTEGDP